MTEDQTIESARERNSFSVAKPRWGICVGMFRKPTPLDDALEELRIERDHVNIQISLLSDSDEADDEQLKALRDKRREFEALINARQRVM